MVATVGTKPVNVVKEKLTAIETPQNQILARLQKKFDGSQVYSANHSKYSRMHNRHNRS